MTPAVHATASVAAPVLDYLARSAPADARTIAEGIDRSKESVKGSLALLLATDRVHVAASVSRRGGRANLYALGPKPPEPETDYRDGFATLAAMQAAARAHGGLFPRSNA